VAIRRTLDLIPILGSAEGEHREHDADEEDVLVGQSSLPVVSFQAYTSPSMAPGTIPAKTTSVTAAPTMVVESVHAKPAWK
jgi:hypothetical protein